MSERVRRLEFDQLAPDLQAVLKPRVERLGYLGEFFKCAGRAPTVLTPFMVMTEALKQVVPANLGEVVALTSAMVMRNDYERHQHEQLCAKLGFSPQWVAAVEALDPTASTDLSEDEVAVQQLAIAVIQVGDNKAEAEFERTITLIGQDQAIAVLFLVGRCLTHAIIVNVLRLKPPVSSIFNEGPEA